MIKAMALQRYRGFVDEAVLEMAPVTLLFGRNSAGKSALLRALPLMAASAGPARPNRTGPLALEHGAAMGASYSEIRSSLSPRNDLVVRLSWGDPNALEVEYHMRDITDLSRTGQVIETFEVRASGQVVLETRIDLEIGQHPVEAEAGHLRFDGLRPVSVGELSPDKVGVLQTVQAALDRFESSVDWLGPLRAPIPRRTKPLSNPTVLDDGAGTVEFLALSSNRDILRWVNDRTHEMFGHRLELRTTADDVKLVAQFPNGHEADLADVGSGASQTIPALTHIARVATGRAGGRIVALEQPEAHLHADAEAVLGECIARAVAGAPASSTGERPVLIVESHSENLLLALQLAVIERRLSPDDVVVYWVSRRDRGAVAEKHKFDVHGRPDPPWTSGVFSETTELARRVVNARRRTLT
ncbi:MAG: hypothetical protein ACOC1F_05355 [Myxococcota bacterium]